ncbi:hypothetical protein OA58_01385 [Microcystis aeruginosa NIES-88]|nr:hypothetical protein OA58_01385 [Microcystis aeruginosa NIES-88]
MILHFFRERYKLPAHLNCLLRRGKRQEARGNSKGIGGDSANLKNKCFKCVLAYSLSPAEKSFVERYYLGFAAKSFSWGQGVG